MAYPKYRILEFTDQFGNKRYLPQVRKSFWGESILDFPFSKWRALSLLSEIGVVKDNDQCCNFLLYTTEEKAKEIVEKGKLQDINLEIEKAIKEKKEREEEKERKAKTPILKVTKKTYV